MRWIPVLLLALAFGCAPRRPAPTTAPDAALRGIALPASTSAEAESLAHALGLETLYESGNLWRVSARLHGAAVVWYPSGHDSSFGTHARGDLLPLFEGLPRQAEVAGLPIGVWSELEREPMPHRLGAVGLVGVTALVPDLDLACRAFERFGLAFGAPFSTHEGTARAASLPRGGWVRLVAEPGAPRAGASPAARWVGVTLSVRGTERAIEVLDSTGVNPSQSDTGVLRMADVVPGGWLELVPYEHAPLAHGGH